MVKQDTFKTHTGEIVTGERLVNARNAVADDWVKLSHDMQECYADHVTAAQRRQYLQEGLHAAEQIRKGEGSMSFTIWQRINDKLTGECVPLFSR